MRSFIKASHIKGRVCGSRVAFVLDDFNAPEPDVSYLSPARFAEQQGKRVVGPPDLAVEVTCDESRTRDYVVKKRLYEVAGVREYWIIDCDARRADFFILKDGKFAQLELESGNIFRSTVIPGFWLDARWLITNPLPNDFDCLQEILAK